MWVIELANVESIYTHLIWDLFEIEPLDEKLSCSERKVPCWEIILQSKNGSLIKNYLTEQEKYTFHYLRPNSLMWNYFAEQEKNNIQSIDHR
jgi:hypothetical protein